MKLKKIFPLISLAFAVASCTGMAQEDENSKELENLLEERDSLKTRLSEINDKIAELDTTARSNVPLVSVEEAVNRDFVHKIEVQGAVETDKNAMLNAEAQGTIRKLHVEEGDKVRKGQALVTIDAVVLSAQIQELQTQLELADYMYNKQKKLMDEGVGTEIEYEQAKAQKSSLEKSIQTMRSQAGKSVVRAPFSGVIDEVLVSIGDMASPGIPLMRIVNNKDVKITASLSESLLSSVNIGTSVDLQFPAFNDTIITTKITSRGNYIDPVNRTFRIRIDLEKNNLLLPNQLAKVNVTDFKRDSALVINAESILQDVQDNSFVYKLKSDKDGKYNVEKVFVKVVSKYKGFACIEVKGNAIKSGDKIVVKGAKGITEADEVTIQ